LVVQAKRERDGVYATVEDVSAQIDKKLKWLPEHELEKPDNSPLTNY
jgi:hypothetical protein